MGGAEALPGGQLGQGVLWDPFIWVPTWASDGLVACDVTGSSPEGIIWATASHIAVWACGGALSHKLWAAASPITLYKQVISNRKAQHPC